MEAARQPIVELTVYSDVLCPWCYNGAVRLSKLEREYRGQVRVHWRSFLLRPYPEPKPLERFRRYTQSWMRPASQEDAGRFRVWSTDEAPPSHSVPPNIAVKAAARQGAFDKYHFALMHAYFYENRNITEAKTLLAVADECGLDLAAFIAALKDDELGAEVARDHNDAVARGVTGVPCVIVDDDWVIPGAQDLSFYRYVVEKRLSRAGNRENRH